MMKLYSLRTCAEIEGHTPDTIDKISDRCQFEARTAFDCINRGKVTQQGDIMDNLGACKHHIDNFKKAFPASESEIQEHCEHLQHLTMTFGGM